MVKQLAFTWNGAGRNVYVYEVGTDEQGDTVFSLLGRVAQHKNETVSEVMTRAKIEYSK